ncbi:EAL domain protein [Agrobacterium fabacearum S56]|nr:EAL domain protein [Agrobacterium fabacearum S56]
MLWITWALARSDEQTMLNTVAERILVRATRAASEAEAAIDMLSDSDGEPCSTANIALMQREVFNMLTIEEMGYLQDGALRCTSWGTRLDLPETTPDFRTENGLDVTFALRPALRGGTPKLAYRKDNYNVLVDPARFVDVITEQKIHMAVAAKDGRVFAHTEAADLEAIRRIAAQAQAAPDVTYAYGVVKSDDWVAIALEPHPALFSTLRREQLLMLPLALMLAGVMVSTVVWFSKQRLSMRRELEIAIRQQEFIVHYQPLIDLKTGQCIGAEALVRWKRPDGSWVRPDLFIPVAEQSGLIQKITAQVIYRIGQDIGQILSRDSSVHIAINLSAEDLADGSFLRLIDRLVRDHRLQPNQIWLEATERGFLDYAAVSETISRAHQSGYVVCIDDFGTGYSSLQHLEQLSFDVLKIDKSFVDSIGVSSPKSMVIHHIIEMAKSLGTRIVAEGVERSEQAEYLSEKRVEFGQGWLFSRALPKDEFAAYLQERSTVAQKISVV